MLSMAGIPYVLVRSQASLVADAGIGPAVGFFFVGGVILFVFVLAIETSILELDGWKNVGNSSLDAFLMNLASTVLGWILFIFVTLGGFLTVLAAWAISVVIEAVVLRLLRRGTLGRVLRVSVLANAASYVVIALVFFGFVSL